MKNKKGFTLVELLAVIVIISILMLLAIPSVIRYVESSKEKTFIEDAKTIASTAKTNYAAGDDELIQGVVDTKSRVSYSQEAINSLLDKKLGKNSYQSNYKYFGVVMIKLEDELGDLKYEYRICLIDDAGNGFNYTRLEDLDSEHFSHKLQNADCGNVYTIKLEVKNGTPASTSKAAGNGENLTFNVKANDPTAEPTITCTNNQKNELKDGVFTVIDITGDATCKINYLVGIDVPASTTKIYNGAEQNSDITCPDGSDTSGVPKAKNVGTYTQICTPRDAYKWSDNTTGPKSIVWKIIPKPVTITAKAQTVVYKNPLVSGSAAITSSGLVSGHRISKVKLSPSTTDVTDNGKILVSSAEILDGDGANVTSNYAIRYVKGKLVITPLRCASPTNIAVTTAGYVTWTSSANCSTAQHRVRIATGSFVNAQSGVDKNSDIIDSTGEKSVLVIAKAPNSNHLDSVPGTGTVTVIKIKFESDDTNKGTVSPTSKNVIKGAILSTDDDKLLITGKKADGQSVNLVSVTPTPKAEYAFSSWSKTSGTLNSSQTITASWSNKPVHIYYSQNGGTIASGTGYQNYNGWVSQDGSTYFYQLVKEGEQADLYNYNNSKGINITKNYYTGVSGKEWCNSNNGTGSCFNQATDYTYAQYKAASEEKTNFYELDLHVNWTPNTYSITYNANGGTGAPSKQTYTYDPSATINLSSTTPTRSGFSFVGWSLSNTATSSSYSAGQGWKRSNANNYTLYAVWAIKPHVHTWTYVGNAVLDIGPNIKIGNSYPGVANGLYCSTCHISAWCYAYVSDCGGYRWEGNYGFMGGTLYSTGYTDSQLNSMGLSRFNDKSLGMTFSKYKTYEGVYS